MTLHALNTIKRSIHRRYAFATAMREFYCNLRSTWYNYLMVTMADMRSRRDEILHIVAEHGGHDLRVFGSVVRGDVTEGSDVDLLVRLDSDRSLVDHIALKHDLEDILGQKVDLVTEEALHSLIRDRILQEAVAI